MNYILSLILAVFAAALASNGQQQEINRLPTPAAAQSPHSFYEADVPLFANHGQFYYRLPNMLVTAKGMVLAASQRRLGSNGDFAPSGWVLRRSSDGGKTFGDEQVLFAREGACTFNGNLVEDRQSGTLFACFITFPQAEQKTWFTNAWSPRGGGFTVVKSTDDGRTWSAPVEVVPQPNAEGWHGGGAFNNNHGFQLQRGPHTGRLIICARVFKPGVYEGRSKGGLIYSDDHGAMWKVSGVMLKNAGGINSEVCIGETGEGEVYVNSRNEASKTAKRDPTAEPPKGLVAHLSRDGGRTWKAGRIISEKSGGYSDDACTPEGIILTLYENARDKTKPRGLLFARYNLTWLLEKQTAHKRVGG